MPIVAKPYDLIDQASPARPVRVSTPIKTLQVVRFLDKNRNVLIYLVYSDKLVEGSPKNSISTVPIMPWKNP